MKRSRVFVITAVLFVCAAITGDAYVLCGSKWPSTSAVYYVNPANQDMSSADALAAIRYGADAWHAQANTPFQFEYGGATNATTVTYNGTNEVFFRPDSSGGTIASTYRWSDGAGRILETDIVFYDGGFQFFPGVSGCSGGIYIEGTAVHEFGHALGLNHSSDPAATMYATVGYCSTIGRDLAPDDIAGVEALYPGSGSTTQTVPAAPSLSVTVYAANPTASLALSWAESSTNVDGYRIDRSSDGFAFVQLAQMQVSKSNSYIDSGLAAGATYYYRVSAFNGAGSSAFSNLAAGQTQSLTVAPAAPSNPTPSNAATGINTDITLGWSCSNAQNYDVYINGSLYASSLTTPSVAVGSLAAGTMYSWSVVARNTVGSTSGPTWSFTTRTTRGRKR